MKLFNFRSFDKHASVIFRTSVSKKKANTTIIEQLVKYACVDSNSLLSTLQSSKEGLKDEQIKKVIGIYGLNEIIREKRKNWLLRLIITFSNPLTLLLSFLIILSFFTGDLITALIILAMILISVILRFYQENQAYNAAEHLRSMVKTTCAVLRSGKVEEIDLKDIVPGDIVQLSAGDLVPADVRILSSKELFINQSLLTGEALSVEKHASPSKEKSEEVFSLQNICLMGTNVESGTAEVVVLATGSHTYFGSLAKDLVGQRVLTSFDKGVDHFTWLMIGFMAVMVPLVFVVNGIGKGNWFEALLFAISVAVGLTPEMLPAIVAVNLSQGALLMSKKKVIVKRLSSIQNFGAMNILCTDKTGTLTQNKIALVENINISGKTDPQVLHFAYLNSIYQTGFKNLLDEAVLKHAKARNIAALENEYEKVDELPFDFQRRRMSVVVKEKNGKKYLVCKGAVEEVVKISTHYALDGKHHELGKEAKEKIHVLNQNLSEDGQRVIAVAYRELHDMHEHYSKSAEEALTFLGVMTFLDPPKESAALAIKDLIGNGVTIKVLTGDNELVTRKICKEVNLEITDVLLGDAIEKMTDDELKIAAEKTTIFAKLSPEHKRRVVMALQSEGDVVGFLGDGINDAPGLRAADVGISVNTAVDIAKESADIILLEMSLVVLNDGVIEGRKVFGNIMKYIKMGASSNFGNMFSVLGASIFLPFLPMLPLQLLTNNLLYDISQTAIPTDNVDKEYLEKPRKWQINDIRRFMFFIGPISSIFDYITFGVLIFIFHVWVHNASLFQTGWFVESLLTQTLIVHVIRSRKIPFLQTWASKPLLFTTTIIMLIGAYLPFSPIGPYLGFVHLPMLFWPILFVILLGYIGLTQSVKVWYIKKFGYN